MAVPIWNEDEKRWVLRISVEGKRKKFTSNRAGVAGKREVLRRAREFSETGVSRVAPTVRDMWPEFLDDVSARATKQRANDEVHGRLYILPQVGSKKISQMSQHDWQKVINSATGRNGRPLAQKTLKNIRGTITSFVVFCYRAGLISTKETSLYIPVGHSVGVKDILQPEEVRRVFSDEFEANWFINMFRLQLLTGLRPGECHGLMWSDVSEHSIKIQRSVDVRGGVTPGKNENARRSIPLTDAARQVLADQKERTAHLDSEWIFCNQIGSMPKQSLTKKYFSELREALGRPDVTPYGLRHTFVSMLKLAVPEQMIKTLIGHSASMSTLQTYGHAIEGDQEVMAAALDAALASTVGPISRPGASGDSLVANKKGATITRLWAQ